jgi:hypothetical protein
MMNLQKIKLAGHVVCIRQKRSTYNVLLRKPEGKKPLRRLRCR